VRCSGRSYYDLIGHDAHAEAPSPNRAGRAAYPFQPSDDGGLWIASYPSLYEVVWAQEEPPETWGRGVLSATASRSGRRLRLRFVGPVAGEPVQGYPTAHGVSRTDRHAPR